MHRLVKITTSLEMSQALFEAGVTQDSIFHHYREEKAGGVVKAVGLLINPEDRLSAWTVTELAAAIGSSHNPKTAPVALIAASTLGKGDQKLYKAPYWVYFTLSRMKDVASQADGYAAFLLDLLKHNQLHIDTVNANILKFQNS